MPQNITISFLTDNNKILMVKRSSGIFEGMLGLPGGKIVNGERINESALRGVVEQTDIRPQFDGIHGVVLEKLVENKKVRAEFLIFVCRLRPPESPAKPKGRHKWLTAKELHSVKNKIVPGDYEIIRQIMFNKKLGYYEAIVEKEDGKYTLKSFERINS